MKSIFFLILTKADPAKVVVALLAVHVVAAPVLVDGDLALGTVLCKLHQPGAGRAILLLTFQLGVGSLALGLEGSV